MSNLNSRELMHMAIHASANGLPDDGVRALKDLLEQEPDNANAHFLLAADFAEIALLNEAVLHYQKAIDLDPKLDLARIQYALLLTALDRLEDADSVLQHFLAEEPPTCFTEFAKGLTFLFAEDLATARAHFAKGIAQNTVSEELNDDMRRLIAQIDEAQPDAGVAESPSTSHLLSAYNKRH